MKTKIVPDRKIAYRTGSAEVAAAGTFRVRYPLDSDAHDAPAKARSETGKRRP